MNHPLQRLWDSLLWHLEVMDAVLDWLLFRLQVKYHCARHRVRLGMMRLRHRLGIHKINGRYTRRIPFPPGVIVTRKPPQTTSPKAP